MTKPISEIIAEVRKDPSEFLLRAADSELEHAASASVLAAICEEYERLRKEHDEVLAEIEGLFLSATANLRFDALPDA